MLTIQQLWGNISIKFVSFLPIWWIEVQTVALLLALVLKTTPRGNILLFSCYMIHYVHQLVSGVCQLFGAWPMLGWEQLPTKTVNNAEERNSKVAKKLKKTMNWKMLNAGEWGTAVLGDNYHYEQHLSDYSFWSIYNVIYWLQQL